MAENPRISAYTGRARGEMPSSDKISSRSLASLHPRCSAYTLLIQPQGLLNILPHPAPNLIQRRKIVCRPRMALPHRFAVPCCCARVISYLLLFPIPIPIPIPIRLNALGPNPVRRLGPRPPQLEQFTEHVLRVGVALTTWGLGDVVGREIGGWGGGGAGEVGYCGGVVLEGWGVGGVDAGKAELGLCVVLLRVLGGLLAQGG
ncbi:uncharacterized protein EV422DRAFT_408930 [Fimicolochytrium jonesii]|uniref:uncharacterized protein n=1 Tax=Fimicolochytrium jonesii TaxID=1396493 RepID=UPI0022FE0703|nr:uncharacterized protein EV422DRAFT_408930 [Fimicolochytrium jonesii]KAI8822658.1 hypothetical protein EV422DRAFT_408930 [Fimicolochytrium jonesii]